MPPMSLEEAACKIQSMYRVRMARRRLRRLLNAVVERFYDEDSGLYYYYNSKTGQSSWSKPTLLGSEEANLSAMYNVETNADGDETIVDQLEDAMEEPQVDESNEIADPSEKKDNNNGLCEQKECSHISGTKDAPPGQDTPAALEATETSNCEREAKEYSPPVEENSKREKNESDAQQTSFTPDELLLIEQQFKKFDKDGSGSIAAEEMAAIMQAFGDTSTLETVKELIQEVDKDGNGEVNLDEFIHILQKQREKDSHCPSIQLAMLFGPDEIVNLRKQFQSLDTDGSGEIDEGELAVLMKALGQKVTSAQLKEIIREVDRNGNGMIDFNEFCHIVYNMRNAKQTSSRVI
ncbi:FK506-binding protein 2B [Aphanomyces cochlioides]|nr:FK506-binding protein 2B [Aphanomyces cochlioides]